MTVRRLRLFLHCYRLFRRHPACQLPAITARHGRLCGECAGIRIVLPHRLFAPLDPHATVLCHRHYLWALQNLRSAIQLELLDADQFAN